MKEKKKQKTFSSRVDKHDKQSVVDFLNQEMIRHISFVKAKKSNEEIVLNKIEELES